MTPAQRHKLREFYRRGYTMAVIDKDGNLIPGYNDWMIEVVLDLLECAPLTTVFDELGQAYRAD